MRDRILEQRLRAKYCVRVRDNAQYVRRQEGTPDTPCGLSHARNAGRIVLFHLGTAGFHGREVYSRRCRLRNPKSPPRGETGWGISGASALVDAIRRPPGVARPSCAARLDRPTKTAPVGTSGARHGSRGQNSTPPASRSWPHAGRPPGSLSNGVGLAVGELAPGEAQVYGACL